ncbi:hypothetical protein CARUB_v10016183mg [Capsella rubella]|uniref:Uncharacterized protein n=1 Tax=Capsella rubella TaxID=81985 RepID=R0I8N8_9BRAS|nr:probable serine/threonine-protein kinase nek3 [Capsella rubella]EOA32868.1 hypothetical protein CARUB_v10016183mg [Capsella rubella]
MASGCVKNVGTSASHSWTSSKMSLTRESQPSEDLADDFEFLLEDPVTMLSADELFSDGKLVPLKFSGVTNSEEKPITSAVNTTVKPCRRIEMEISGVADPYLFSPRAPRCTVRWRELLGLKRLAKTQEEASASASSRLSSSSPNPKTASFRHFLNRGSKSTAQPPSPPPPGKDSDVLESSSTSISSSRLSLSSSSSSGHELEDLPRLSLDLDNKPGTPNPFGRPRANHHHHHLRNLNHPRKPRRHTPADESTESSIESRGMTVTADSPRLNASGKIVFHGLERSSSSPGNFTGGPRMKLHHGMPRSHSANVRITPVLNVPVSSLRSGPKSGLFFGQLFASSSSSSSSGNRAQLQSNNTKNRTNRTRLEPTSEL